MHLLKKGVRDIILRGGVTKKNGKIWDKFPIRLSDIFEKYQPSPLGTNSDMFEIENILMPADPLGYPSKKSYLY